jgi:hypothetical protein
VATRRGKELAKRAEAILGAAPQGLSDLEAADLDELVIILRRVSESQASD